jgi:hypothetical protein
MARFSLPPVYTRTAGNPTALGNDGHADTIRLRADWLPSHPI